MPGPLLGGRTLTAALRASMRARQTGPSAPSCAGRHGPLTLACNRARTLGALAYAASESLPAARRRAELASAQKRRFMALYSALSGVSDFR